MKIFILYIMCIFSINTLADTTRIMLLGDSLTYDDAYIDHPELGGTKPRSIEFRHAYRNYLWYKLQAKKYDVNFVGSRISGQDIIPAFDPDNEGYPGYKSYQISHIIYSKLEENEADIILLHIGSNDWSTNVSGINQILNEIDRYEQNYHHHIKVVLAQIINRRKPLEICSIFNENMASLVASRIKEGDDIFIVDMEHDAALRYGDYQDTTHPNNIGYEKMATVWFDALEYIFKHRVDNNLVSLISTYMLFLD